MSSTGQELVVPPEEYESQVCGWIREAVQEGEAFLKQQKGYNLISTSIEMIFGDDPGDMRSKELSQAVDNEFGNIALDLASALTDTQPFWHYRTANPLYEQQADIFGKLTSHWWLQRQIDQRFMDAIKYTLVAGTAYLHTVWDPQVQDFVTTAEDPRDVLPLRPRSYHTLQDAFAVIIRKEKTVNELQSRWPDKDIRATRDGSAMSEDEQNYAAKALAALNRSPYSRYREFLQKAVANFAGGTIPVTDLYTAYIDDRTRNESTIPRLMGPWSEGSSPKPLTNWAYRAEKGDLLYPRGRIVVATPLAILYDGPSNMWHRQKPISKITLDSWPFPRSFFGKAPLWDIIGMQRSLNKAERAIEDHVEKFVGPDVVVDPTVGLSRGSIDKLDPRKSRGVFKRRPGPGEPLKFLYPEPLPQEILQRPEFLINRMRSLTGIEDIASVLKLQQVPSESAVDAIMNASPGPIRGRSRALEAFMREFAMQMAFNFAQYKTVKERLAIAGAGGVTFEDFDYDPNTLIPAHVGSDYDNQGNLKPEWQDAVRPREDRAQEIMRFMTYHATPGSFLDAANMTDKMAYLQFFRAGIMDPWTLYEKWEVPNVGEAPNGARTITDRLVEAARLGLIGQVSAAGRKSSGQQPPQQRSSGAISESG